MNAPARIAELERQLHWVQLKIQVLEEELRQRRIQPIGSTQRNAEQSATAFVDRGRPGATRDEVEAKRGALDTSFLWQPNDESLDPLLPVVDASPGDDLAIRAQAVGVD